MEKVSIIIPVYNGERYLDDTIQSCLNQTYENKEIVIIDDGSSDSSGTIVERYRSHERIIVNKNEKNMGLMFTLNKGLGLASGTKVLPIGQDDLLTIDHIEKAMKSFEDNVVFVFNNPMRIDENGNEVGRVLSKEDIEIILNDVKYSISKSCCIPSTGAVIDKNKLLECGGYDTRFKNYGEWIVWIKLLSKGECRYLDNSGAFYRTHAGNLTSTQLEHGIKNVELTRYQLYCLKTALRYLNVVGLKRAYLLLRYIVKCGNCF